MVGPIPLGRPPVFAHFVPDVLDAAEDRKHLAAGPTVLGAELAGEALAVAEAPVDNQPSETPGPTPASLTCLARKNETTIVSSLGRSCCASKNDR